METSKPKREKIRVLIIKQTSKLFSKFFGFDDGIDITNDVMVLNRRNIVIKNIIFLSNLIYSAMFLAISVFGADNPANWLISALSLPITFSINQLLSKLINLDPNDLTKQQVAMYVAAFYMFLSSILVYLRIFTANADAAIFETAAYILIYYALVVISLYQDKKMLTSAFFSLISVLTVIHFVGTYDVLYQQYTFEEFFSQFIKTTEFGDIILRTIIFMLFYLVIYSIVSIGQQIHEERKEELKKRREAQDDFINIVRNMFKIVFSSTFYVDDEKHANKVYLIAHELASVYNLDPEGKQIINTETKIHLRADEVRQVLEPTKNLDYEIIKEKTRLGQKVAKRIQILQKASSIVRSHVENTADDNFIENMNDIQNEITSQIILMADIYVTLRSPSSYKRPYAHQTALNEIKKTYKPYFELHLHETFIKYAERFEEIFNMKQ